MKINLTTLSLLLCTFSATSQTKILAVDTLLSSAASSFSYTNAGDTYNWGVSPNDTVISLYGFNAGSVGFTYAGSLTGSIKLRRVNNANVSGNFTLEWVQETTNGTIFNMNSPYQKSLDTFLNNHTYNKGTDNLFDNTSVPNSNDVERLDWIKAGGFSTPLPKKVGVAVFDKGIVGVHDPFCIAAITSVDALGDPLTYGNIVRVASADYGDPGPSINYRIAKALYPSDLLTAGTTSQNLGGVFISLEALGIAANTQIFGYSLFANDLPVGATPADLVDFTNVINFPTTTSAADGGLDLVAVTGLYISNAVLPVSFVSFNAVENNDIINLKWAVENETPLQRYDIERSEDGIHYIKINEVKSAGNSTGANSYSLVDNVSSVASTRLYYRIKQYEPDGSYYYSKTILVRRNNKTSSIIIFPNPVKGNLYLNIGSTINDKAMISIFNSAGSRVIQQQEQLFNGNNSLTIDGVNKLSKGIYQLSIKWSSGRTIIKQFTK